jgi:hypothetical protein
MKSKCLVWFLAICIFGATTALSQEQAARPVRPQKPGNLSQDVILVPVKVPAFAAESVETDGPFNINAIFDANVTPQQRAVIQQAINEWTAIIRTRGGNPGNYPIAFSNGPLANLLGLTTTSFNSENGNLVSATMVFDNDGSDTWYVDPNPADDVEFNGTPPAGYDLLTVARHELGHALGFADTQHMTALISGNVFDPTHLNIGTDGGALGVGRHTDPNIHPNDIMNPSVAPSVRQPISLYPAASMLARAYFYDITMSFANSAYPGVETGSANAPWNTLRDNVDLAPFGRLLLAPGTYNVTVPLTLSRPMTITVARGGGAVIR